MLPAVFLLVAVVLFRIAPWMSGSDTLRAIAGFSPLMALALCGGIFLKGKQSFWLAAAAVIVPHLVINSVAGFPVATAFTATVAVCALAVAGAGIAIRKKASLSAVVATSLLSTVLFHLVSNTVSFFVDPAYTRSFAGWWQCQTIGRPEFLPTWVFTLRQLAGDTLFSAAFYLAFRQSLPGRGILPAAAPSAA